MTFEESDEERPAPGLDSAWLDNIHIVSGPVFLCEDIATEMQVDRGAIVNVVLCKVSDQPTIVLMAGDMPCDADQVGRALNRKWADVSRLTEGEIREMLGIGVDHISPITLSRQWPTVMDASLKRFPKIYTREGSRSCLVETSYRDLKALTGAIVSYALAPPDWRSDER